MTTNQRAASEEEEITRFVTAFYRRRDGLSSRSLSSQSLGSLINDIGDLSSSSEQQLLHPRAAERHHLSVAKDFEDLVLGEDTTTS